MGQITDKANGKALADELLGDITMYILHRYHQLQDEVANKKNSTTTTTTATGLIKNNTDDQTNLSSHKATASVLCGILPRKQVISFMA